MEYTMSIKNSIKELSTEHWMTSKAVAGANWLTFKERKKLLQVLVEKRCVVTSGTRSFPQWDVNTSVKNRINPLQYHKARAGLSSSKIGGQRKNIACWLPWKLRWFEKEYIMSIKNSIKNLNTEHWMPSKAKDSLTNIKQYWRDTQLLQQ